MKLRGDIFSVLTGCLSLVLLLWFLASSDLKYGVSAIYTLLLAVLEVPE